MTEDVSASAPERPTDDDPDAWRAYWKGQGMPWRTAPEIATDRQAYLAERRAITPDIKHGVYPFKDLGPKLTRADIEWLLATHESRGAVGPVIWGEEKDKTNDEQRAGLDLRGSDLTHLDLRHLPLTRLIASVTLAEWLDARDELDQQAYEQLESADLLGAHLEGADLFEAHLEGAKLVGAQLNGADLRLAFFDNVTALNAIALGTQEAGFVVVADARWGGVNLAVVDWTPLLAAGLGDERAARQWKPSTPEAGTDNTPPSRKERAQARQERKTQQAAERLQAFQAAVRANRQLATALRSQGMNEEADQLAYRAQVLQRQVFRQQGKRGRSLLWGFLDLVAGHGYKPGRSLATYALVLASFTMLFLLAGAGLLTFGLAPSTYHQLPWYEAIVLSVASFHGRGFFQPVQSPGDPIAILASIEAVFGLFIEVSFIATFTQRFFGK